jgi:hypothetical protein
VESNVLQQMFHGQWWLAETSVSKRCRCDAFDFHACRSIHFLTWRC